MFNFFKKKEKTDLEKVKELGLITEEEMLKLQLERIEKKLENLNKKKK